MKKHDIGEKLPDPVRANSHRRTWWPGLTALWLPGWEMGSCLGWAFSAFDAGSSIWKTANEEDSSQQC